MPYRLTRLLALVLLLFAVSGLRAESDERGVGPHTLDLLGYQPATRKLYYLSRVSRAVAASGWLRRSTARTLASNSVAEKGLTR